ncbi:hypothetical protein C0J52_24793 [Blattella germanica]|nr:hypothetical protein C0J52_24793 [Blattella germanica]
MAKVCRKWRQIAYDTKLWRDVSLRPEISGLHVTSLEFLLGLITSTLRYIELPIELITHTVLHELANKCPNLTQMLLDFSTAMQLHDFSEMQAFPTKLRYLCICLSEVIFMEGFMRKIYNFINGLEILHLIGTYEKVEEEEEEIYEVINVHKLKSATPNLRVINLYGINFVDDSHIEAFSSNCIQLECLAVNFCAKVLKAFMESGNAKNLIAIDLDSSDNLTDEALHKFLSRHGQQLWGIALSGMPHITDQLILIMGTQERLGVNIHVDQLMDGIANNCIDIERLELRWDPENLRFSDKSQKAIDVLRVKCLKLKCLVLSDGRYYETTKANFERADRMTVVRTTTSCRVSNYYLLTNYKDLIFN